MRYGISRDEEGNLPSFKSHNEARNFLKEKYGDDLQLIDSDFIGGEKIYFYKLILNKEVYLDMIEAMNKGIIIEMNEERLFCTQDIQIFENGHVHIVH